MLIPDASQMLVNLSGNIPELMKLATAIMYVLGMYIIIISLAGMRNAPTLQSAGQGQTSMWTLWKHVFVGAALIYFPSLVHVGNASLFSTPLPYAYVTDTSDPYSSLYNSVFMVIQLVGVIAVGKGVYELGFGQGQKTENGHQGGFQKGLMHMIGGIMCINLPAALHMILSTLGISGILN